MAEKTFKDIIKNSNIPGKRTLKDVYWKYIKLSRKLVQYFVIFKYGKKLQTLRNIHKGGRCFIIGNGPSLCAEDLEKLKTEYTFAVNKIYLIFEETNWRPYYYCIQDEAVIRANFDEISEKIKVKKKFVGVTDISTLKYFQSLQDWIVWFRDPREFYPNLPLFSEDIIRQIYEGFTVTYANMQLAVYMGFSEIYLLGIDHQLPLTLNHDGSVTTADVKSHFSDKYLSDPKVGVNYFLPRMDYVDLAYTAAKEYAEKNGIKIYNATRGGKLEIFERVNFDSLFVK